VEDGNFRYSGPDSQYNTTYEKRTSNHASGHAELFYYGDRQFVYRKKVYEKSEVSAFAPTFIIIVDKKSKSLEVVNPMWCYMVVTPER
jgi:hypothetical protein